MLDSRTIESLIISFIHQETGWCNPILQSEHEEVSVSSVFEKDSSLEIFFVYYYNENHTAKGNHTHVLEGSVTISSTGKILSGNLEEIYTGDACQKPSFKSKKK